MRIRETEGKKKTRPSFNFLHGPEILSAISEAKTGTFWDPLVLEGELNGRPLRVWGTFTPSRTVDPGRSSGCEADKISGTIPRNRNVGGPRFQVSLEFESNNRGFFFSTPSLFRKKFLISSASGKVLSRAV